jgi:hypothetical protein
VREARRHDRGAQSQQAPAAFERARVLALVQARPAQLRGEEGLDGVGVGDLRARLLAREARERGELAPSAVAHRARELALEVAEIEEGRVGGELLAHEEERHRGSEQQDREREAHALGRGDRREPLAQRAVAHLVVVLQEGHEGRERQVRRGLPAPLAAAMRGGLALVGEAFGERAREHACGLGGVVAVVAVGLAGHEHVEGVVRVVVPLRGGPALDQARRVGVVLEHEVDLPLQARALGDRARDLLDDVRAGAVGDGVDRVHAQPVEAVLLDPVERVVDEEIAHGARALAVEVDRGTPGRLVGVVEERACVLAEVVPLGPEVVVDDVQQHHEAARMRGLDEFLQVAGKAVGRVGRERQHAVVAPVAPSGAIRDRHELDRGHAELGEVVEPLAGGVQSARVRERAQVQLVEHRLVPGPPVPLDVVPRVRARIDHDAGSVHVPGIEARCRIGDHEVVAHAEGVGRSGTDLGNRQLMPSPGKRVHVERARRAAPQLQAHVRARRRPEAEARRSRAILGAEGHGVRVLHETLPSPWRRSASARPSSL